MKCFVKSSEKERLNVFGYCSPNEDVYRTIIGWVGIIKSTAHYAGAWGGSTTPEVVIYKNYLYMWKNKITKNSPEGKKNIIKRWTGNSIPQNIEIGLANAIKKEISINQQSNVAISNVIEEIQKG